MSDSKHDISVSEKAEDMKIAADDPTCSMTKICMALIALVSTSSIGPILQIYEGTDPLVRSMWRYQLMSIYIVPMTVCVLYKSRNSININQILTLEFAVRMLLGGAAWTAASAMFALSLNYTIISHTIILSNLSGVCIITLSMILCVKVHKLEMFSVFIVLVFVFVLIFDKSSTKTNDTTNILLGG